MMLKYVVDIKKTEQILVCRKKCELLLKIEILSNVRKCV